MTSLTNKTDSPLYGLNRFFQALEILRTKDLEMPAQLISTFLYIAANDGCKQEEVTKNLNLTSSSTSRNIARLTKRTSRDKKGLGWVYKEVNPIDPKRYLLHLSRDGKHIATLLENTLKE